MKSACMRGGSVGEIEEWGSIDEELVHVWQGGSVREMEEWGSMM